MYCFCSFIANTPPLCRIGTYVTLYQEFDNFLMDPLNLIDILVVGFDVALMLIGDGAEGDVGGLIKGLRGARGFRLLRLLRALKAMRGVQAPKKLSHEDAKKDARSVKISFSDLCKRQLEFIRDTMKSDSTLKAAELIEAFSVISLHLEKYERRTDLDNPGCGPSPFDVLDKTTEEIEEAREEEYVAEQRMVKELGTAEVVCMTLCASDSDDVVGAAFRCGENMLNRGFIEGQEKFLEYFVEKDPDSLFFFAIRDRINACR